MENTKPHFVLIVAGGTGKRMNSDLPKQFIEIHNKPIIFHTIEKFLAADSSIEFVISLHQDYVDYWKELIEKHQFNFNHEIVTGGEERFFSVKNALEKVPKNALVGIHDAVRPLVSKETILSCFDTAKKHGSAIPVVDSVNSLRYVSEDKNESLDRKHIKQVQTPQYFDAEQIKSCYLNDYSRKFTDDASVFEANNSVIKTVEGNPENIKITSPIDLIVAKELLR
ncbi:MAG: 2-C-methyl-D-erythritol 4-phosphate cytidylyltransferase [Flavobacteriales bacterium]